MKRKLIIAAGVALTIASTGTVLAVRAGGSGPPEGVTAGLDKATNNVTNCTKVGGGGGKCDVSMKGDYFDRGLLGNGKYAFAVVIDWTTYGNDPNQNSENCATVSGTEVFTSGSSVLKATLIDTGTTTGGTATSVVCEANIGSPPPYLYNRDWNFSAQVTSGTGKFQYVDPSQSQMYMNGFSYNEMNSTMTAPVGVYFDQAFPGSNFTIS